MPTCRHCASTYPREQFIHGNGPKTQVCVRCALDLGLINKDDAPNMYTGDLANARFGTVARRYSILLYIPVLWTLWIVFLSGIKPWGTYFLVLILLLTLLGPVWFIYRGGKFSGDMARLTPQYDRPKGH